MKDETRTTQRRDRLLAWASGAGIALYLGRVWAEFGPEPFRPVVALVLGLAALLASRALLARRLGSPAPLAPSWLYVLWPSIAPDVAGAAGFLIVSLVLMDAYKLGVQAAGLRRQTAFGRAGMSRLFAAITRGLALDWLVFGVSLAVYVATLAPTVLPADAGEFQLVARTLGIAHPPGYPLYTLLGWLFTALPFGDAAYRVNLLSAVTSAATLAVAGAAVRRLTCSAGAGIAAALALGAATTFWAQATTANIRSLTALFTALLLLVLIRYRQEHRASDLAALALVFGLAVGHHLSLAVLALPAAAYLLVVSPRALPSPRTVGSMLAAFALGLTPLLYLPLRGATDAPLNPGGLTTLPGFLRHVLALGFQGDMLYFAGSERLPDRLAVLANILDMQFGLPLLVLAGLGLVFLARRAPREALLVGGMFAANAAVAITYRAPQTVEYLMPAYVALVVLVGEGARGRLPEARFLIETSLLREPGLPKVTRALSGLLVAVALLFGVRNAWVNWPSYRILSQDRSARDTAASLLAAAPKDSTILSGWHQATPMWYLQTVEGMRPDVRVGYVAPRGAEPIGETWRRRVSESAERQPTIATDRYPEMAGLPFPLAPFHGAFLAQTRPATDLPAEATPVAAETVFGGQFRLRGYTLAPGPRGEHQVNLYWQALAPAGRDYATFVHVVDGAGKVWGQADTTHAAATWQTDRLLADVYRVVLLAETPPGTYRVMAGMYTLRSDGTVEPLSTGAGDAIDLTSVEVRARDTAPVTAHPLWQPFGSGPALIGVDYDTGRSESLRVYLHWRQDSAASFPVRLSAGGKTVAEGTLAGGPGYVTTAYDVPAAAQDLSVEVPGHAAVGPFGAAWRLRTASDGDTGAFLPRPPAGERWLSFGGELALTRADVSPGGPGSQATVDLEFISLRPLTADYSVSVQAPGWGAQSDGTPALGAIPTFKWVRSTRVLDRHRLAVPVGTPGTSPVGVTVYDAFTQEPLGVLDDRAVRAGEGTRVTVGKTEAVMRSP